MPMKITHLELHVLLVPDYDPAACSSAQDDLVVEVHTDEGIVGIGETDTNPWVGESASAPWHPLHGPRACRKCSWEPTRCSPTPSGSECTPDQR